MVHRSIQITVNSSEPTEEGEFTLHQMTLDEAAQVIADNAPNWTSLVLVVTNR